MGKAEGIGGSMDRRKLYYFCLGAVILAVVLGVAIGVPLSKRSTSDLDKANQILQKYPLIDGHNDLPWQLYNNAHNQLEKVDLTQDTRVQWENSSLPPQTDIPRLITGRLAAQFWAAFVNCRAQEADAVRLTLEQIDVIKRFANKYSQTFQFVTTAQGIEDAFNAGRIGSLIGVEGGHSIDSSLATLRMFYDLGVRYMTITHVCNTPWADASKVDDPNSGIGAQSNGLNDFGKSVIREMNRLGMLVDISHVSKATMEAVLDVSVAPVIHSHSSAWQLCNHDRNVQDDILRKTTTNGGVVMVNFYNNYITCNDNATTQDVADHVDYIKNVAGVDHVGIGADYDGVSRLPQGLEDVSTYPNLFAELLKRGWSEEDLAKLAGGNLLRVFRKAEEIRDNLQQNTPNEELIAESLVSNNTCRLTFKQSVTFG